MAQERINQPAQRYERALHEFRVGGEIGKCISVLGLENEVHIGNLLLLLLLRVMVVEAGRHGQRERIVWI